MVICAKENRAKLCHYSFARSSVQIRRGTTSIYKGSAPALRRPITRATGCGQCPIQPLFTAGRVWTAKPTPSPPVPPRDVLSLPQETLRPALADRNDLLNAKTACRFSDSKPASLRHQPKDRSARHDDQLDARLASDHMISTEHNRPE